MYFPKAFMRGLSHQHVELCNYLVNAACAVAGHTVVSPSLFPKYDRFDYLGIQRKKTLDSKQIVRGSKRTAGNQEAREAKREAAREVLKILHGPTALKDIQNAVARANSRTEAASPTTGAAFASVAQALYTALQDADVARFHRIEAKDSAKDKDNNRLAPVSSDRML
ncbi:hypothetical protein M409DRAFT_57794 [Zasmidium cellare ATCC 36951]|uniref:Uncharacterized protein n=1 Tax=Zasmidium cellare ATCC 36951 TaxID=1080233 RepID=A0A6A6C7G1_ZASCE|nr:uncharacterized protein M409DRAFT_57794 [Zasmidium cellare ATCC 36951]KAF2163127.1 hypothetical protein M409DRAFT_57794 [Zasmidium cellare ATCC 36951]